MFVVYSEPIEIVWRHNIYISIYLIQLELNESFNRRYQQMEIFTSTETVVNSHFFQQRVKYNAKTTFNNCKLKISKKLVFAVKLLSNYLIH